MYLIITEDQEIYHTTMLTHEMHRDHEAGIISIVGIFAGQLPKVLSEGDDWVETQDADKLYIVNDEED